MVGSEMINVPDVSLSVLSGLINRLASFLSIISWKAFAPVWCFFEAVFTGMINRLPFQSPGTGGGASLDSTFLQLIFS